MNNLSWLLYAADVVGSVSAIGTTLSIFSGIGGGISFGARMMAIDFDNIGKLKGEKQSCLQNGWRAGKPFFIVSIAAACVVAPIPSKSTMYAIAASEMGEDVLASKTGNKAVKALNVWLDRQIAGEPK